jgi:membrane protease YdiL (CAAX protease family)
MPPDVLVYLVGLAGICLISGSAAAWLWIVSRWRRGEEPLAYEPRLSVPWVSPDELPPETLEHPTPKRHLLSGMRFFSGLRLPHAVVLLTAYLLLQVGCGRLALDWSRGAEPSQAAAVEQPSAEPRVKSHSDDSESAAHYDPRTMRTLMASSAIVNIVFALLVVVVLHFGRVGASCEDLGLPLRRLPYDLRVGLFGFVAASVPVYLLQGLLSLAFPGEHPIIKFVRETHDLASLAIAAATAVLVAPVVEELLFRVLLQGWLEAVWPSPRWRSPAAAAGDVLPVLLPHATPRAPVVWQPIVVSSGVFALLHAGHGPDPIPLFVLALVLGYLYQRTHRIWASVALHFSLNLCSLLMLWAKISMQPAP